MKIKINKKLQELLNLLNKYGSAYIVGGYIRDSLLNSSSNDIDIATNIKMKKLLHILKEYNPKVVNIKYEIISFKLDEYKCEIARFRKESGIDDGRNPMYFEFIQDINTDLKRRDFTINTFAYNGKKLISYNTARKDLENNKIVMVGKPETRLKEDKTRILRAFYLMSRYGFELDCNLEKTILNLAENKNLFPKFLNVIVYNEFEKILVGKYNYMVFEMMYELKILEHIIPAYKKCQKNDFIISYIIKLMESKVIIDLETILAIIFSLAGKKTNDLYEKDYEKDSIVRFDNFRRKYNLPEEKFQMTRNLIYYHTIVNKNPTIVMLKKLLLDLGNNKNLCRLLLIIKVIYKNEKYNFNKIVSNIQSIYLAEEPVFLHDLEISNIDLYNLKIPNKKFTQIKMDLFKEVLSGRIPNSKYELLEHVLRKEKQAFRLKFERASGAIVYRINNGVYEFLLIRGINQKSITFPKGHIENNENETQTAIREVKEETNIDIEIIGSNKFKRKMKYLVTSNVYKEVSFFIAKALNYDIKVQKDEIESAIWLPYDKAMKTVTFSYQRLILKQAMLYLYKSDER